MMQASETHKPAQLATLSFGTLKLSIISGRYGKTEVIATIPEFSVCSSKTSRHQSHREGNHAKSHGKCAERDLLGSANRHNAATKVLATALSTKGQARAKYSPRIKSCWTGRVGVLRALPMVVVDGQSGVKGLNALKLTGNVHSDASGKEREPRQGKKKAY